MDEYPAVQFMVKYGRRLSLAVGVAPVLLALAGVVLQDWSALSLIVAVVAGGVFGFAFRTFAELTQIIADMLLPQ